MSARIAVVGGGLCGIVCAGTLAEAGMQVTLLEAAPQLGGRTRSWRDRTSGLWLDNGPHLLSGAYRETQAWLRRIGADRFLRWQDTLQLRMFDPASRAWLSFAPPRGIPFALALLGETARRFGPDAAIAALRLRFRPPQGEETSADWLRRIQAPTRWRQRLLDPLHLAALNAASDDAPAASFARVLDEAFASRRSARLGWFTRPLGIALIQPAVAWLKEHSVELRCRSRVRAIASTDDGIRLNGRGWTAAFDAAVLALPAHARDRLLGHPPHAPTRPIANLYLWAEAPPLPAPFVGVVGTPRWWFDLHQMLETLDPALSGARLFCAVASASEAPDPAARRQWIDELGAMLHAPVRVRRLRLIVERRATTLPTSAPSPPRLPRLVDAAESPIPGGLPATIELAVRRGLEAARSVLSSL